jgi:hypothetical protein
MAYRLHRKPDDIHGIVAGRQLEILTALGIKWDAGRPRRHINCPYPDHKDERPSWRWDHDKGMAYCSCCHANIFGVVERVRGCDWRAARDFCREALHADPWRPAASERPMPDHLHVVPDESSANEAKAPPPWQRPITATFDYPDEHGEVLFQSVKFADSLEPRFMQRHPDGQGGWKWGIAGVRRILYRLPELVAAVADKQTIYLVEGEKDVESLRGLGLTATTNPLGAGKWLDEYSETLRNADVIIIGDNDAPGLKHVEKVAASLHDIAKRVRVLDLAKHWSQCPHKGDISDWFAAGGSADQLNQIIASLPDLTASTHNRPSALPRMYAQSSGHAPGPIKWSTPKPLPTKLARVEQFKSEFLPEAIAPWVSDIAERLQCPPDFVGVAAVTALGSTVGRRVGIKPQQKTDWLEIPNIWGLFIGPPGVLKSPAMNEALKPVHHLEAEAAKEYEVARQAYEANIDAFKLRKSVLSSLNKEALRESKGKVGVNDFDLGDEPQEPAPVRYRTNDSSYEKLGELLVANPAGIMIERDELVSLLKHLDREEQAVARGFYLSGWSGTQPYTFDRIGRGRHHIDAVCVSVLGNTQPARICEYVRRANADGAGGDGLIQRFGLMVWPDLGGDWENVDRYPDARARETAWSAFERLSRLDTVEALRLGAEKGPFDKLPCLRFDEAAGAEFLSWRKGLEKQLRGNELPPALEGHLAKYRKLVPALALINHLADGHNGPVAIESLLRALAFIEYLESHACRIYGAGNTIEVVAGEAILAHIRQDDLVDGFTARDVHRHAWSNLTDREHLQLGLNLLVDLDYLAPEASGNSNYGGRPKITYRINPEVAS